MWSNGITPHFIHFTPVRAGQLLLQLCRRLYARLISHHDHSTVSIVSVCEGAICCRIIISRSRRVTPLVAQTHLQLSECTQFSNQPNGFLFYKPSLCTPSPPFAPLQPFHSPLNVNNGSLSPGAMQNATHRNLRDVSRHLFLSCMVVVPCYPSRAFFSGDVFREIDSKP